MTSQPDLQTKLNPTEKRIEEIELRIGQLQNDYGLGGEGSDVAYEMSQLVQELRDLSSQYAQSEGFLSLKTGVENIESINSFEEIDQLVDKLLLNNRYVGFDREFVISAVARLRTRMGQIELTPEQTQELRNKLADLLVQRESRTEEWVAKAERIVREGANSKNPYSDIEKVDVNDGFDNLYQNFPNRPDFISTHISQIFGLWSMAGGNGAYNSRRFRDFVYLVQGVNMSLASTDSVNLCVLAAYMSAYNLTAKDKLYSDLYADSNSINVVESINNKIKALRIEGWKGQITEDGLRLAVVTYLSCGNVAGAIELAFKVNQLVPSVDADSFVLSIVDTLQSAFSIYPEEKKSQFDAVIVAYSDRLRPVAYLDGSGTLSGLLDKATQRFDSYCDSETDQRRDRELLYADGYVQKVARIGSQSLYAEMRDSTQDGVEAVPRKIITSVEKSTDEIVKERIVARIGGEIAQRCGVLDNPESYKRGQILIATGNRPEAKNYGNFFEYQFSNSTRGGLTEGRLAEVAANPRLIKFRDIAHLITYPGFFIREFENSGHTNDKLVALGKLIIPVLEYIRTLVQDKEMRELISNVLGISDSHLGELITGRPDTITLLKEQLFFTPFSENGIQKAEKPGPWSRVINNPFITSLRNFSYFQSSTLLLGQDFPKHERVRVLESIVLDFNKFIGYYRDQIGSGGVEFLQLVISIAEDVTYDGQKVDQFITRLPGILDSAGLDEGTLICIISTLDIAYSDQLPADKRTEIQRLVRESKLDQKIQSPSLKRYFDSFDKVPYQGKPVLDGEAITRQNAEDSRLTPLIVGGIRAQRGIVRSEAITTAVAVAVDLESRIKRDIQEEEAKKQPKQDQIDANLQQIASDQARINEINTRVNNIEAERTQLWSAFQAIKNYEGVKDLKIQNKVGLEADGIPTRIEAILSRKRNRLAQIRGGNGEKDRMIGAIFGIGGRPESSVLEEEIGVLEPFVADLNHLIETRRLVVQGGTSVGAYQRSISSYRSINSGLEKEIQGIDAEIKKGEARLTKLAVVMQGIPYSAMPLVA